MKRLFLTGLLLAALLTGAKADVDPNFYIYLCFGQSNMEGNAQPESVDKTGVDTRFKMLATTNFNSPNRTMGQWYTATPPIVSPQGGLGMADYFGRTMVAALPLDVTVGVVDVAIGEREGIRRKPAPDTVNEAIRQLGVEKETVHHITHDHIENCIFR